MSGVTKCDLCKTSTWSDGTGVCTTCLGPGIASCSPIDSTPITW